VKTRFFIVAIALVAVLLAVPNTGLAWRGHGHHYGGWYGPGVFAGGFLLGTAIAAPRYYHPPPVYAYPPPPVVYAPPPAYAYPDPAYSSQTESPPSSGQASAGQWVDVPAQSVNGVRVPAHKAWVPDGQ
jgi:hypothetical protein